MKAMSKEMSEVYSQLQLVTAAYSKVDARWGNQFNSVATSIKKAKDEMVRFSISWELAIKLVAVQLAHQAISSLIRNLQAGILSAIELQKRLAEVRTISQNNQLTTAEWQKGFEKVSNSYGIDMLDVIAGGYEAISNQVVSGAQAFKFMEEAAKFAITALVSTKDAVNILSTAINTYGETVEEANTLAAKYFKTIEVGRIRGEELANIGQVIVPAEQLGISLNELLGITATLTRHGLKSNETFTQLRGVFTALLKPTEAMKEFFDRMNVSSGEQLIASRGILGTFDALRDETKGLSTELAALVPRQRGMAGAMLLTGRAMQEVKEDILAIADSMGYYNKAVDIALESTGRRLQIELEKTRNYFRNDLGTVALKEILNVTEAFGGLDQSVKFVVDTLKLSLLPAIILTSRALVGLSLAHPFAAMFAGAALTITKFRQWSKESIEILNQISEDNLTWINKNADASKAETVKQINDIKNLFMGLGKESSKSLTVTLGAIKPFIETSANYYDSAFDHLKLEYTNFQSTVEKDLDQLKGNLTEFKSNIKSLESANISARSDFTKVKLSWELDETDTPQDKLNIIKRVIKQLDVERVDLFNTGNIKEAISKSNEMVSYYTQMHTLVKQITNENERNARATSDLIRKQKEENAQYKLKRQELKIQLIQLEQERKDPINEDGSSIKGRTAQRRELQHIREKELKIQESINELALEHAQKEEELKTKIDRKTQQTITYKDIEEQAALAIEKQIKYQEKMIIINRQLAKESETRLFTETLINNELKIVSNKAQKFDREKVTKLDDTEFKQAIKEQLDNISRLKELATERGFGDKGTKIASKLTESLKIVEEYELEKRALKSLDIANKQHINDTIGDINRLEKHLIDTRDNVTKTTSQMEVLASRISTEIEKGTKFADPESLIALKVAIRTFVNSGDIKQLDKVMGLLRGVNLKGEEVEFIDQSTGKQVLGPVLEGLKQELKSLQETSLSGTIDAKQINALSDLIILMESVTTGIKGTDKITPFTSMLADLEKGKVALDELGTTLKEKFNIPLENINEFERKVYNIDSVVLGIKAHFDSILEDMGKIIAPISIPTVPTKAFGGSIHGSDSVHAMLTPGEYVVNAGASRKFYSQLVAMNSGMRRFASGGPVTSINGDFNVSVNSSGNPGIDAVKIGKALRREIRRGRVSLV